MYFTKNNTEFEFEFKLSDINSKNISYQVSYSK